MLIATSLSRAAVVNDDAGNDEAKKHGVNNTSRDDVAASLDLRGRRARAQSTAAISAVTGVGVTSWHGKDRVDFKRWRVVRLKALDRDGWKCVLCSKSGRLEVDHRVAMDVGGAVYELQNIQSLCRPCHFQKTRKEREVKVTHPEVQAWRKLIASRIRDTI